MRDQFGDSLNALHITGNDLRLEDVREVAVSRQAVLLSPDAREAVNLARTVVDEIVASNSVAYAITTGVGKLSDVRIVGEQIRELQVNLVRSHAFGVGSPLPLAETRAMVSILFCRKKSKHGILVWALEPNPAEREYIALICTMNNRHDRVIDYFLLSDTLPFRKTTFNDGRLQRARRLSSLADFYDAVRALWAERSWL